MDEDRVSACSSEESVLSEDLCEVTVKADSDGEERVLLPAGTTARSDLTNQSVSEAALGGTSGCTTLFLSCVSALKGEPIIQRSPRGKRVQELLCYIEKMCEEVCVTEIAVSLVTKLYTCIISGEKRMLPSAVQGCVWSSFHKLRNSDGINQVWTAFMTMLKAPEPCRVESQLALQLLMDRVLKKMLKNKADAIEQPCSSEVIPLTIREKSAIRYMAGYVAVKLLKRYEKPSTHPQVNEKRKFFIRVLKGMSAAGQPITVESLSDYTRLWSELIDRGGLYHINDEVLCLMEEVEIIVRHHLSAQSMQMYNQGTNIHLCITDEAMKTNSVLCCWETIAHSIPPAFELYSIELLKAVISLWVSIRGHAFAKGWTMQFERKYKKGTRKSLKPKVNDKT